MAKSNDNTHSDESTGTGALSGLQKAQAYGAGTAVQFGQAMMDTLSRCNAELMEFVNMRLQEDIDAQKKLMSCNDPVAFTQLQAEFFRTAMAQYQAEAAKMMKIGTDAMTGAIQRTKD